MNVIEVDNVSKMFRLGAHTGDLRDRFNAVFAREQAAADRKAQEFWALQDISFSVAEGESFGIIGHNGSGKSTLLKLITGIYTPTKGKFKTRGRIAALIEVGAGFHPDLTGRENVYLNGSVLGMKKREIDAKFDEIVAFSELEKFIDTPVKRYSSGMYMRLGFAVASNINPDIVLVDEVLAVGDESFQRKCMNKMLDLRAEGKTIVFISHAMSAVTELCQRVMLLSRGNMIDIGDPKDLIAIYRDGVAIDESKRKYVAGKAIKEKAAPQKPTPDIKILDVRLLNDDGTMCDVLRTGKSVRVECDYMANSRVEKPVFGMSLLSKSGLYIYGFNTKYDGVATEPINVGEGRFSVTFHGVDLLPGEYRFNLDVSYADDVEPGVFPVIDGREAAATFIVTSNTKNLGVFELAHSWDLVAPNGQPRRIEYESPAAADTFASSKTY